jgi:hypothetical protein
MEQLRDIKGLVEVTDYSFYYLLGLIGLGIILIVMIAILVYKKVTKKVPMTQQRLAMKLLKEFEVSDAKESAYAFSHLAQYAVNDTQRQQLEALLAELEPYKFRKEVPELDEALKIKIKDFAKELSHG